MILDIWMPGMDGIELLRHIRDSHPGTPVIVISGHGNIETAVTATKLGAFDFIEKPFSLDGLLHVVDRALESRPIAGGIDADAVAADEAGAVALERRLLARPWPWVQRTIQRSVVVNGQGLHSGVRTGLILQPLPPGSGIVFGSISNGRDDPRPHRVRRLDRLRDDALPQRHRREDGRAPARRAARLPHHQSAREDAGRDPDPRRLGLRVLRADRERRASRTRAAHVDEIVIDRRYEIGDRDGGGEYLCIEPADVFGVHYILDYPAPVGRQEYVFQFTDTERFKTEIAPARTFGFLREIETLEKMGLASGGRLNNCILIGENGVVNTPLRFPDEFARHKILDIFGDFYLLGRPLRGFVTARMTGHSDNVALLKLLRERFELQ